MMGCGGLVDLLLASKYIYMPIGDFRNAGNSLITLFTKRKKVSSTGKSEQSSQKT